MERLRKGLSIFAAAALLAPAGGALAGRPVFQRHHENHERDDDKGGMPAKGSAGDLTLRSRALLGKDGITQLEISTAPFDTGATPPGNISEVHVRAVDPNRKDGDDDDGDGKDGKEYRFRREYNHLRGGGYFTDKYPGMSHGLNLRIQAKARGAVHRDELEAKWLDSVRYRPDLYVKLIDAPAKARINTLVLINAVIAEGMGDTGADTDCVLLVDGVQVDKGLLWVNAAGSAACSFGYTFTAAGQHTLTVSALNVRPGDYDLTNNSLSQQITITQPFFAHYDATASEQIDFSELVIDTYLLASNTVPDQHLVRPRQTTVSQLRSFMGTLPADANPNVFHVAFQDFSGGQALSSFDLAGLTLGDPQASELPGCPIVNSVLDADNTSGRQLFVGRCTDPTNNTSSTTVSITYPVTQTTTFSENLCRNTAAGCKLGDVITNRVTGVGAVVTLANDYSASVSLDDGNGSVFTAKPQLTLAQTASSPLTSTTTCLTFNGKGKRCTTMSSSSSSRGGKVSVDNAE